VEDGLSVLGESGSAVGHDSLALSGSDLGAEVGLFAGTEDAASFLAFGSVAGDNNVTNLHSGDSFTDGFNDTGGFVTENAGEKAFGVVAVKSVDIGVAEGIGEDLESNFTGLGGLDFDFSNVEGLLGFPGDGSLAADDLTVGLLELRDNILRLHSCYFEG